jgi:hypothetical protein
MILLAVAFWILNAALLALALLGHPRRVPTPARAALRWMLTGVLLIETSAVLGLIAQQHDWAHIHRAIGAIDLLLSLTALACLATAVIAHRRIRPRPGQPATPPNA